MLSRSRPQQGRAWRRWWSLQKPHSMQGCQGWSSSSHTDHLDSPKQESLMLLQFDTYLKIECARTARLVRVVPTVDIVEIADMGE